MREVVRGPYSASWRRCERRGRSHGLTPLEGFRDKIEQGRDQTPFNSKLTGIVKPETDAAAHVGDVSRCISHNTKR